MENGNEKKNEKKRTEQKKRKEKERFVPDIFKNKFTHKLIHIEACLPYIYLVKKEMKRKEKKVCRKRKDCSLVFF